MTTPISNKELFEKCREFIVADPQAESLDQNIKNALVTANREIAGLGEYQPLAWMRQGYDELFTRVYASVSAITQANPGVITAESNDSTLSSDHGFQTGDIVYIEGVNGMERMNNRFYIATRASATTITLTQLDGTNAISTSGYEEYDSGGYIYHAGILLPHATIEPTASTTSNEAYRWKIKRVWNVMFDTYPSFPKSEEAFRAELVNNRPSLRPKAWRYWRKAWDDPSSYTHHVMFIPTQNRYNISISVERGYPDLSVWDAVTYPPHPPEIHDFIWHRALANLITLTERQRREIGVLGEVQRPVINTNIEIMYARTWLSKRAEDELAIKRISKQMLGEQPSRKGLSA